MNDTIHITTTTFFKKHPVAVANLKASDWERANQGQDFTVDFNGEADGHYELIRNGETWYIFTGHCTFIPDGGNYLVLTKTDGKDSYGGVVLNLQYFKGRSPVANLHVCSGRVDRQSFRKGVDSVSGSGEPIPEGRWYINNIYWADGKDNYSGGVINSGLGPASLPLTYDGPAYTRRDGIEAHLDWNRREGFPGTVGCIGFYSIDDYKKFVSWLRDTDPRYLFVNWGLGTCAVPR